MALRSGSWRFVHRLAHPTAGIFFPVFTIIFSLLHVGTTASALHRLSHICQPCVCVCVCARGGERHRRHHDCEASLSWAAAGAAAGSSAAVSSVSVSSLHGNKISSLILKRCTSSVLQIQSAGLSRSRWNPTSERLLWAHRRQTQTISLIQISNLMLKSESCNWPQSVIWGQKKSWYFNVAWAKTASVIWKHNLFWIYSALVKMCCLISGRHDQFIPTRISNENCASPH